jgi:hypothetical protein
LAYCAGFPKSDLIDCGDSNYCSFGFLTQHQLLTLGHVADR